MVRAVLLCLLLSTGACAWTPDTVLIQRQAVPVASVAGAAAVAVSVTSAEARQEREVSHKKNGYGMRAADISAANDIVEEIRAGVREILSGQGFREGSDAIVRVEVARFYNTFDMGFWSATANAQATANVHVSSADGRALYSRIYTANHQMGGVQLMSADNAGSALRIAMHQLLQQVANDPQLSMAIMQARRTAPTPLAPGGGRPRLGS